jgi:hypothetical protein
MPHSQTTHQFCAAPPKLGIKLVQICEPGNIFLDPEHPVANRSDSIIQSFFFDPRRLHARPLPEGTWQSDTVSAGYATFPSKRLIILPSVPPCQN